MHLFYRQGSTTMINSHSEHCGKHENVHLSPALHRCHGGALIIILHNVQFGILSMGTCPPVCVESTQGSNIIRKTHTLHVQPHLCSFPSTEISKRRAEFPR